MACVVELSIKLPDKCPSCLLNLQMTTTLYDQRTRVSTACWRSLARPPPLLTTPYWHSTVPVTVATTRAWPPTVTCRSHGTVTSTFSSCSTGRAPGDAAVRSTWVSIDSLTRVATPSSLSSPTAVSQVFLPSS